MELYRNKEIVDMWRDHIVKSLKLLMALKNAGNGLRRPNIPFCRKTICCLLEISRNMLWKAKMGTCGALCDGDVVNSIVDMAGVRMSAWRWNKSRKGFPSLKDLHVFECGFDLKLLYIIPPEYIKHEYNSFWERTKQPNCTELENRHNLKFLFCPTTNSTVCICERSIGVIFTMDWKQIPRGREIINSIIMNYRFIDMDQIALCTSKDKYPRRNPMNRIPDTCRRRIESQLNMFLRPDPRAKDGVNTCRLYSQYTSTHQKLVEEIRTGVDTTERSELKLSDLETLSVQ